MNAIQSLVKEPFKTRRELLKSSFNEIDGVSEGEKKIFFKFLKIIALIKGI